jgi:hypothetical protein
VDALPGIVPCPLHLQYLLFNARLGHPATETVIKEICDYYGLVIAQFNSKAVKYVYSERERSASDDLTTVLRIRDILERIRIRSSYWVTDPSDPAIFVNDLQDGN